MQNFVSLARCIYTDIQSMIILIIHTFENFILYFLIENILLQCMYGHILVTIYIIHYIYHLYIWCLYNILYILATRVFQKITMEEYLYPFSFITSSMIMCLDITCIREEQEIWRNFIVQKHFHVTDGGLRVNNKMRVQNTIPREPWKHFRNQIKDPELPSFQICFMV